MNLPGHWALPVCQEPLAETLPGERISRGTIGVSGNQFLFRVPGIGRACVDANRIVLDPDEAAGSGAEDLAQALSRSIAAAAALVAGELPLRGEVACHDVTATPIVGGPRSGTSTVATEMMGGAESAVTSGGIVRVQLVDDEPRIADLQIGTIHLIRTSPFGSRPTSSAPCSPHPEELLDLIFLRDFVPALETRATVRRVVDRVAATCSQIVTDVPNGADLRLVATQLLAGANG